jgi:hypothetical protein
MTANTVNKASLEKRHYIGKVQTLTSDLTSGTIKLALVA